ncbi:MAG: protease modulator HflC [Candidatus Cloacimonetes bacterium]|nr:protease modulator HflC [Candidatus Cloacimonadota bacterium]
MKFKWIIIIALVIIIINSIYILDETEQVIITRFGDPVGNAVISAGLHGKVPLIDKVNRFEKRILEWDGDPRQIPTADKRFIWIDTFSRWKIKDPLKFFETTRSENQAHSRLDDIISGKIRDIISSYKLIEIVRNSNRNMSYSLEFEDVSLQDNIDEEIFLGRNAISDSIFVVASPLIDAYGIELIDVKIKRINYVKEVRQKVYERMISERQKIAAKYRSEGNGKAAETLGKMQKELDLIQSGAYKTAQEIKGKADAKAIKIYADAYNRDPEFYQFIKTLETYEKTIDNKNTLIMSTDSDYYKYMKKSN